MEQDIKVKAKLTGAISALISILGLLAIPLVLLLIGNIFDYITALMACYVTGEKITSRESFIGICKKIGMYFLIGVGYMMDILISYSVSNIKFITINIPITGLFACVIAVWLVFNELLSITENLNKIGVPVPVFLKPIQKLLIKKVESVVKTEKLEDIEEE